MILIELLRQPTYFESGYSTTLFRMVCLTEDVLPRKRGVIQTRLVNILLRKLSHESV